MYVTTRSLLFVCSYPWLSTFPLFCGLFDWISFRLFSFRIFDYSLILLFLCFNVKDHIKVEEDFPFALIDFYDIQIIIS